MHLLSVASAVMFVLFSASFAGAEEAARATNRIPETISALAGYWTLISPFNYNVTPANGSDRLSDLLDPGPYLTIAPGAHGAVTIIDGHGASHLYQTTGHLELQACGAGMCETSTVWQGRVLRQEMRIDADTRLVRSYELIPENDRVIETVVVTTAGSPETTFTRVYESDRVP